MCLICKTRYQDLVDNFKVDYLPGGATQNSLRVAQVGVYSALISSLKILRVASALRSSTEHHLHILWRMSTMF